MQIMPATGKEEAQKISIRDFEPSMLNQPEVNIQVGTRYIYYLSSQFKGSPMLIIGAYNRGPGVDEATDGIKRDKRYRRIRRENYDPRDPNSYQEGYQ